MKKIRRDHVTGLALIILGVVVAVLVMQFKKPMTAAYPGPKLFPLIAAFGFVACGLGIFIEGCLSKKEEKPFLSAAGWKKVGIMFAVLIVYVFLMKYLGYMLATPFALFAFTTIIEKGEKTKAGLVSKIIYSVAVTVFIYLMYVTAFGMTFPSGMLFE